MHPGVYNLKLDPDAARELVLRGAALIFLDVPEGTALGIDQRTFLVGPNFKGVKMVPPGMHAVSYASSCTHQGGFGPTTALFVHVGASRIAAWRWQRAEETLRRIEDDDEIAALEKALKSFQLDSQLAPYDLPSYATWQTLSGYISPDVVDAVAPVGGNINILTEAPAVGLSGSLPVTAAEIALEEKLAKNREKRKQQQQQGSQQKAPMGAEPENSVEGLENEKKRMPAPHAGRCFFTPLPRLIKRAGLSPGELTALNLDKSAALHEALAGSFRGREDALLGEFQFAFLAFLLGHSLEGFAQWKSFLSLMFGCYQAVEEGSLGGLFAAFLRALQSQLDHALTPVRQVLY
jgi:A1 cistron-splicing factor AAR2